MGVQGHLQHPVHQGAALVRREPGLFAGFQPQHIPQEIPIGAVGVGLHLAGGNGQPVPQQASQGGQVLDLVGRVVGHPGQQGQAGAAAALQGLDQAGPFHPGEGPAAPQAVQGAAGGGGHVQQRQIRGGGVQHIGDGLGRRREGQPRPLGPADPQPFGGGGHGLVKTDLFPHHPVFKAVGQLDFLPHQSVPVGVGQQAGLARGGGEFPFRHPQHKDIVGGVQPHLARRGQHHCVQGLGDVAQVRGPQQQPKQLGVLRRGDGFLPQQLGHLVQQVHHHVPLPGRLLGGGNPLGLPQGGHLLVLGLFGPQGLQAEPQGPADLEGGGLPAAAPQRLNGPHQKGPGPFGLALHLLFFPGELFPAKAPGALVEGLPPLGGFGRPGIGVVFQGAHRLFRQAGEPGFHQGRQLFGVVGPPHQLQQGGDCRSRGAEGGGGGLVAPEGDPRHPEFIPHRRPVLVQFPADHRNLAAADPPGHQPPDGAGGGPGFLFPAGGGVKADFRSLPCRHFAPACGQQLPQSRQAGGLPVAEVFLQQQGHRYLGAVFPGQPPQLGPHRLGPRKEAQVPRVGGGAVVAQGHRHLGQSRQHGPHQTLLGGVEGVELVDEHRPSLQKGGDPPLGQGPFQPVGRQLDPVGRVHAGLGQQGLVPLVNQGQLGQAAALGAAALGQPGKFLPGDPGAFQLVDGLGGQLAEGRAAPVAVVIVDIVLQLLQGPAHQGHPARVGEGVDGGAPLLREDPLGQAGEGKALHIARALIPQFPVDSALGGGGELFRHQQDAVFLLRGPPGQLGIEPAGLSAARTAQHQFQHGSQPPFWSKRRPIAPPAADVVK